MRKALITSLALAGSLMSTAAFAGISQNNKIKAGNSLLLGGTQAGWIDVDGQNRGKTDLELLVRKGETLQLLTRVKPGKGFNESVAKNQILIIRNTSNETSARVYWHISGYSKAANPRIEENED